eukprot:255923-Amphidinium_carterae.1
MNLYVAQLHGRRTVQHSLSCSESHTGACDADLLASAQRSIKRHARRKLVMQHYLSSESGRRILNVCPAKMPEIRVHTHLSASLLAASTSSRAVCLK